MRLFRCRSCRRKFSILTKTLFERTKIDLRKWVYVIVKLSTNSRKGISSLEVARDISVRQATAWKMLDKIRRAMKKQNSLIGDLAQIVEVDETFLGGKPRKNNCKWINVSENPKMPAVTIIERPASGRPGRVKAFVPRPDHKGRRLTQPAMTDLIEENVDLNVSEIHTDESPLYKELERRGVIHESVLHRERYVDAGGHIHINTAESFHALPKRMHFGIYHRWGKEDRYIELYLAEAVWRWNHRADEKDDLFGNIVRLVFGLPPESSGGAGMEWVPMQPLSYGQQDLF